MHRISVLVERRSDYAEYQARTNAFFPGPPRDRTESDDRSIRGDRGGLWLFKRSEDAPGGLS
jgi:hypothetical protein